MREVLVALNRIVADGVVGGYAIGGAIGASFYIEAANTEDVDAFVVLPVSMSGLVSLNGVYEALVGCGGVIEREHVRFGMWPLQVLPDDGGGLISEAIREAIEVDYEGVHARVFRAEYLCAIALKVGRKKDLLRVEMFREQGAVDDERLATVMARFGRAG